MINHWFNPFIIMANDNWTVCCSVWGVCVWWVVFLTFKECCRTVSRRKKKKLKGLIVCHNHNRPIIRHTNKYWAVEWLMDLHLTYVGGGNGGMTYQWWSSIDLDLTKRIGHLDTHTHTQITNQMWTHFDCVDRCDHTNTHTQHYLDWNMTINLSICNIL